LTHVLVYINVNIFQAMVKHFIKTSLKLTNLVRLISIKNS